MPNDANVPTGREIHESLLTGPNALSREEWERWIAYGNMSCSKRIKLVSKKDVGKAILRVIQNGWTDLSPKTDMDPHYWDTIFRAVYSEKPAGNSDPRWDYLLQDSKGPRALRISRRLRAGFNK